MIYIIDRFEGDIAVCENEDRECVDIHRKHLPENSREGSAIDIDDSGKIVLLSEIDRQKFVAEIREKIREKYAKK